MTETCLLIKTKDNRKFLTHEKNLPSLVEFAKAFGCEIYTVEPEKGQKVLELKTLTAAICNPEYESDPKGKKLDRVYPRPKRNRKAILNEAGKIRKFITKRLLNGKPVSLKDLKDRYREHKLTDACLCNHLAVARKILGKQGYQFIKVGAGKYCLVTK